MASADNVVVNDSAIHETLTLGYTASPAKYTVSNGSHTITMDTGVQSLQILGAGNETIDVASSITGTFAPELTLDGGTGSSVNLQGTAIFKTLTVSADETVSFGNSSVYNFIFNGSSGDANAYCRNRLRFDANDSGHSVLDRSQYRLDGDRLHDQHSHLGNRLAVDYHQCGQLQHRFVDHAECRWHAERQFDIERGESDSNSSGPSNIKIEGGLTMPGYALVAQADTIEISGAVSTSHTTLANSTAGAITLTAHQITLDRPPRSRRRGAGAAPVMMAPSPWPLWTTRRYSFRWLTWPLPRSASPLPTALRLPAGM